MKKVLILAAALLLPLSALAGMTAFMNMDEMSSGEMATVSGQKGITIEAEINQSMSGFSWVDLDGGTNLGMATSQGALHLYNVQMATINLDRITLDVGSTANTSWLIIGTTADIVSGNMTIGDVVIGTLGTSTMPSLGEFNIYNMAVNVGTVKISGH